jgi:hypothetical protein
MNQWQEVKAVEDTDHPLIPKQYLHLEAEHVPMVESVTVPADFLLHLGVDMENVVNWSPFEVEWELVIRHNQLHL